MGARRPQWSFPPTGPRLGGVHTRGTRGKRGAAPTEELPNSPHLLFTPVVNGMFFGHPQLFLTPSRPQCTVQSLPAMSLHNGGLFQEMLASRGSSGAKGQPVGQAGWAERCTSHALQPLATRGLQITTSLSREVIVWTLVFVFVLIC